MSYSKILYSVQERICTITMHRPEKRNALDDIVIQELTSAIVAASKDTAVKVIVLTGHNSIFCAGADLEYLQKLSHYDFNQNSDDSKSLMRLFQLMYTLRKPIIAKVNGPAIAGGCGLATVCDIIIASSAATFGYTEVKIGFIPAIVLPFLVKRIGEAKARELVLTGNILSAHQALSIGLVNEVVDADTLDTRVTEISQALCNGSSNSSMGLIKEMLSTIGSMNINDALEFASNMNAVVRMSEDCKKGISAFINKEKNIW